jgi:DNA (cytosine-5)-methyltransferase 1
MKLLDLFCCAGGAAMGYHRAGFDVYGVDLDPQPRYPFAFHQGDAIAVLSRLIDGGSVTFTRNDGELPEVLTLADFDAIHASPPCQLFTSAPSNKANFHDLVNPVRELLHQVGVPWVIENVVGAPMVEPAVLCGTQFGMRADDVDGVPLKLVRHRLFESNVHLSAPTACNHDRTVLTASVYGAGGGWTPQHRDSDARRGGYIPATSVIQKLMGIDWMSKHEMSESIPPVFTEHVGGQLMAHLRAVAA